MMNTLSLSPYGAVVSKPSWPANNKRPLEVLFSGKDESFSARRKPGGTMLRSLILAATLALPALGLPALIASPAYGRVDPLEKMKQAEAADMKCWTTEVLDVLEKSPITVSDLMLTPFHNSVHLQVDDQTGYIFSQRGGIASIEKYSPDEQGRRITQKWEIEPKDSRDPQSPLVAKYWNFSNGKQEPPLMPMAESAIRKELSTLVQNVFSDLARLPRR